MRFLKQVWFLARLDYRFEKPPRTFSSDDHAWTFVYGLVGLAESLVQVITLGRYMPEWRIYYMTQEEADLASDIK